MAVRHGVTAAIHTCRHRCGHVLAQQYHRVARRVMMVARAQAARVRGVCVCYDVVAALVMVAACRWSWPLVRALARVCKVRAALHLRLAARRRLMQQWLRRRVRLQKLLARRLRVVSAPTRVAVAVAMTAVCAAPMVAFPADTGKAAAPASGCAGDVAGAAAATATASAVTAVVAATTYVRHRR